MKIRRLDLDDSKINAEHDALNIPPPEYDAVHLADAEHPFLKIANYLIFLVLSGLLIYLAYRMFWGGYDRSGTQIIIDTLYDPVFWTAVLVGLFAQVIDGALGMAYGITSSSFLLATGSSPAMASGATHLAEVFTTGVSGASHLKMGNINKTLFFYLLVPGVIGSILGAYVLANVDGKLLKPFISVYLLGMGLYVLSKAFRKATKKNKALSKAKIAPLAMTGGFMDTSGGGGWGAIVTTTLIGSGHDPRTTIGTVNFAEFFLTITVATALFSILDYSVWISVSGLVLGGVLAAPFAAYVVKHLSAKTLLMIVGSLISMISLFNCYQSFGVFS